MPAVDTGKEVHSSIFKVRDIMSGGVECVFETDSCSDAATRMLNVREILWQPFFSDRSRSVLSAAFRYAQVTRRPRPSVAS